MSTKSLLLSAGFLALVAGSARADDSPPLIRALIGKEYVKPDTIAYHVELGFVGALSTATPRQGTTIGIGFTGGGSFSLIDLFVTAYTDNSSRPRIHIGDVTWLGADAGYWGGANTDQNGDTPWLYIRFRLEVGAAVLLNVTDNLDVGIEGGWILDASGPRNGNMDPYWGGVHLRYGMLGLSLAGGYGPITSSNIMPSPTAPFFRGELRWMNGGHGFWGVHVEYFGGAPDAPAIMSAAVVLGG